MDELHSYESYGWTIFVCCTSYLRIYFIYIQVTDSLHPYVKKNRSIRTSVTQKNVYLRRNQTNTSNTFTSIEPQPLSTKENDHEWEKPDHNDKSKRIFFIKTLLCTFSFFSIYADILFTTLLSFFLSWFWFILFLGRRS